MTIKNTLDVKPKALSIYEMIIKNIFDRPSSKGHFSIGDIGDIKRYSIDAEH